jgi:PEP-CTERM motif
MQSLLYRFSTHTPIARQALVVAAACLPMVTWAQMTYVSQVRTVTASTSYFYTVLERIPGSEDIYGNSQFQWVQRGGADSEVITSDPADFGSFSRTADAYLTSDAYYQNYVGLSTSLQSTLLNDGIQADFSISLKRERYAADPTAINHQLNDWGRSLVQTTFDLASATSFEVLLSGPIPVYPDYSSTFQLVNDQTGAVTKFNYNTPVQLTLSAGRYSLTSDIRIGNYNGSLLKGTLSGTFNMTAVPEPSTWGMMLLGILGIGQLARRKRNA